MKIRTLYIVLIGILSSLTFSCKEDVNDWGIEKEYDGVFRPLAFGVTTLKATSVELAYTLVNGATKYQFEFSEGDSLEFNNIVRTIEILADTLTPYTESSVHMKTICRTIFEDLNGTTRYSVRMKALCEGKGMESGYVQTWFYTPAEQIITKVTPSVNKMTVEWEADKTVTHVFYGEVTESDTIFTKRYVFTDNEKTEGKAVITGLNSGTTYALYLYNDNARRGTGKYKTLGIKGAVTIDVEPDQSLTDILAEQVANEVKDVCLVFAAGNVYEPATMTIPDGIQNLSLVGDTEGVMPEIFLHQIVFKGSPKSVSFQYINMDARSNGSNYVISIGDTNCPKSITFEGCVVQNIGRSLVRLANTALDMDKVSINNCMLYNIGKGGYGLFNIGVLARLDVLSITNTTLREMGDQLMQTNSGINSIVMDKCIFCNYVLGIPKIFRLDKQPGSIKVTNTIFCGTNNNTTVNSGNGDYSGYLEFATCFLTSDFVENTRKFTNIEKIDMTSETMFVDPRNGDFHIKEGVKFYGAGIVGDPRWW